MPDLFIKTDYNWKKSKNIFVKKNDTWAKVRKYYVKKNNTWNLVFNSPIVIDITEDRITNSENSNTIENPENYRLDVQYRWNGSSMEPVFDYTVKKCWYNLDLNEMLTAMGLTGIIASEVIINLRNVYIGSKIARLYNRGTAEAPDYYAVSRRNGYSMSLYYWRFNKVTIVSYGRSKIQGYGGWAIERLQPGRGYEPYSSIVEYAHGNRVPFKDVFGAAFCYIRNDWGWRAYTDEYRLNAMRMASKYIDFKNAIPNWNPNDIAFWPTYKTIMSNADIRKVLIPYSYDAQEFPTGLIKPYCLNSFANNGSNLGINGGHALYLNVAETYLKTADQNSKLCIYGGCAGGQGYMNRGYGNGVYLGSAGGQGLPGGLGAFSGYVHKQSGWDDPNDFDEAWRSDASSLGDISAPVNINNDQLEYGKLDGVLNNIQSNNLHLRYRQMYAFPQTLGGARVADSSYFIPIDTNVNYCLVGGIDQGSTLNPYEFGIGAAGLAINRNGKSVITEGNIEIIGPQIATHNPGNPATWVL